MVVSTFLQAVTTVWSCPATFVKFIVVSGVTPINLYNALYLTDVAVVPVPRRITVYDAGVGIAVSSPYIVTNKKSFRCKFKGVKLIDVTLLPETAPKNAISGIGGDVDGVILGVRVAVIDGVVVLVGVIVAVILGVEVLVGVIVAVILGVIVEVILGVILGVSDGVILGVSDGVVVIVGLSVFDGVVEGHNAG